MKPPTSHTEPLTVVMRVRPTNSKEYKLGAKTIVHPVDDKLIVLKDPHDDVDDILRANRSREKRYVFDHIFSPEATQEDVYYAVVHEKGIIESVLSGYNCTVFAYGATGTGKTHTMLGSQEEPGIMVHTLNSLFKKMDQTKEEVDYQVSMGYLEIYNECVRDLLCPDIGSLELREDASGSITVSNLLDISASSTDVILGMLRMGNTNRTSEPTVANRTSSRSHAILKVNVEQRSRVSTHVTQEVKCGSLYMVDLAGSERAAVTQNRGKRMIEGAHINRSLLALANCINALGSNSSSYVNYRDSKLTRILKEALGGNCKTVMIAHVSPASSSYEETRNTMVYADRSKKIKNKARQNVVDVNHHVTQYLHIIDELQYQVARLKAELDKATVGTAESSEVTGLCEDLRTLAQEQKGIRMKVLDIECQLLQNALDYQKHSSIIKEWEVKRETLGLSAAASFSSPLFVSPTNHSLPDQPALATSTSAPFPQVFSDTTLSDKPADSISLKQAGNVASITELCDVMCKKAFASPDIAMDSGSEDYMSGEVQTGAGASVMYHVDEKPKNALRGVDKLLFPISPDSGTEMSMTATTGGVGEEREEGCLEIEPVEVSSAREGVATLAAAKQRLESQHLRVERGLRENRASISEIRQKLSAMGGFMPMRRDMMDLLQHTSDLEASQVEHSLSTMLMGIHLSHHTSLLDQLLQHSSMLLALLETHRAKMEEDGRVGVPEELTKLCRELSGKQKRLAADVADVKMLPVLGDKLQLPSLSRLSAKLYTTMTGSKSNFFSDDEEPLSLSNDAASMDGHLPNIDNPSKRSSSSETASKAPAVDFSLPPIHFSPSSIVQSTHFSQHSLAANKSSIEPDHKSLPEPIKKSDLAQILEAAKKIRDEKIAATAGTDRLNRAKKSPRKVAASRVTNFSSPRASLANYKSRYTAQQTIGFQSEPNSSRVPVEFKTVSGEAAEIIDLESSEATMVDSYNPQLKSMSLVSLQGRKSRSQTHLTTSPSKPKPPKSQRLRRSRSHARIGSQTFAKQDLKRISQSKSVSLEDIMPTRLQANSPVLKKEQKAAMFEQSGITATTAATTSKPIVRKPSFIKQTVPKLNIKQADSVYGTRPHVIPMAKRVSQQGSSPQRLGARNNVKKRTSHKSLSHLKRKHQRQQRQELTMPKVHPGSVFSTFTSPYLDSSPVKQGGSKAKMVKKISSSKND